MEKLENYIDDILTGILEQLATEINTCIIDGSEKETAFAMVIQVMQQPDDFNKTNFSDRLRWLELRLPSSYTILLINALFKLYNKEFDEGKYIMDNLIDGVPDTFKIQLAQLYRYIQLTDLPKENINDIPELLASFTDEFESNEFELTVLLWEINNSIHGDDSNCEGYLRFIDVAREKNPDEIDIFNYLFYILKHFEKWKMLETETIHYINTYLNTKEIPVVHLYYGEACYQQKDFYRALKSYKNTLLLIDDNNWDDCYCKSEAAKMAGKTYIEIGKSKYKNIQRNHDRINWYYKAKSMYQLALENNPDDTELKSDLKYTELIISGLNFKN